MKAPLQLVGLVSLGLIGCGGKVDHPGLEMDGIGFVRATPIRRDAVTERAMAIEKAADVVVMYDGETMYLNPSLVAPDGSIRKEPSTRWKSYFDSRRRKNLVVVMFEKNVSEPGAIAKTNRYFFARGYERVVIHQAHSSRVATLSDVTRRKEDGS